MRQQDFWFRREQQRAIENAPVEWLFAKPIASDEEPFSSVVPQSEGEHAIQVLDHFGPVLFVKVRQNFCV
jgi:hypothetical protein